MHSRKLLSKANLQPLQLLLPRVIKRKENINLYELKSESMKLASSPQLN